jgi:hypothetical protein
MPYEFYKVMHLVGLTLTLIGLGGILAAFATSQSVPKKIKGLCFGAHGLGLILMLVGGFGMAARLGLVAGLPGWIYAKLAVWLILGGMISAVKRKADKAAPLMLVITLLVGTAVWLAIYKPGA